MKDVKYSLTYINDAVNNDYKDFILKSEERYTNILNDIAKIIFSENKRKIIMLAGPSSSGKTTSALKLANIFKSMDHKAYTISLDDFYKGRDLVPFSDDGKPDFETVYALDLPLLSKCLNELIMEGESDFPVFDFKKGKRSDELNKIKLDKEDIVIVEGLHALNPIINGYLPENSVYKLFINIASVIYDEDELIFNKRTMRFLRRLVRDYNFRNSSVENTYNLWGSVQNGENKYLFPFKETADFVVDSIHLYEPCIFKPLAISLLEDLDESSPFYENSKELIRKLNKFAEIPLDAVPENSLLREFILK